MDKLRTLMNGVFGRAVPAEFAAENYDYEAALRDEIAKLVCRPNRKTGAMEFNRHAFDENKHQLFELLGPGCRPPSPPCCLPTTSWP